MASPAPTASTLLSCAAAAMALGGISLLAASLLIVSESRGDSEVQLETQPEPVCYLECALPAGVSMAALSTAAADELARRSALCADLACGRMSQLQYQAALDALAQEAMVPLADELWATELIDVSSEYSSDSWSAAQVLGEPDTYPESGDNSSAWASLAADGKTEFIEVAVPAHRVSAVRVYETFNPGAIRSIDIRLASGALQRVFTGEPRPRDGARIEEAGFSCTDDKVIAVRVTLDTSAVAGWNEIDAISVHPCR